MNPIPTIHTEEARKRPSMCQTPSGPRSILPAELIEFTAADVITEFSYLDPIVGVNTVLPEFQFKDYVYNYTIAYYFYEVTVSDRMVRIEIDYTITRKVVRQFAVTIEV